mmetsp:Transcript_89644/g.254133  ORF Transcript_89644/g.254133 Transcript_89644/m.254133 type:complete len:319 (-) Transcript_89644:80-1036(-)
MMSARLLVLVFITGSRAIHLGHPAEIPEPRFMEPWGASTDLFAIGSPPFNRSTLKKLLPEFVIIYDARPVDKNHGGINFYHAFNLYAMIRILKPKHVIESGAFKGVGTWFLRQACDKCQITVISPENPTTYRDHSANSVYFTGKDFQDFSAIHWDKQQISPAHTLVFFDDHQAAFRRVREAKRHGFVHLTFDDNYGCGGDNYALKKVWRKRACVYTDNFGQVRKNISAEEAGVMAAQMNSLVAVYHEMPPVAMPLKPSNRTLEISCASAGDVTSLKAHMQAPLLSDHEAKELEQRSTRGLDLTEESAAYTHMPYVQLQ